MSALTLLRRLLTFFHRPFSRRRSSSINDADTRRSDRDLSAESLEPRILYSAAPVDAPAEAEAAAEAPVEAVPAAAAAPTPAAAEQAAPEVQAPEAVATPTGNGETSIPEGQGVTLVDVQSGSSDGDAATPLTQEALEEVAEAAKQRWIDSGISEAQLAALNSATYQISDLGGNQLGSANGSAITIDDDAGGTGTWFIDATPDLDEEFSHVSISSSSLSATLDGGAFGHYDLLSAILHEQGHVLGLDDLHGNGGDLMNGLMDLNVRRLPGANVAADAVPGSVEGVHFLGGSGNFTLGQSIGSSASLSVKLADLDGDNDLDAFVTNVGQANKVWFNNGSGVFSDSGQNLGSSQSYEVSLGDLDGNGTIDAFVANHNQANKVWWNNGSGVFTDSGQNLGSSKSTGVRLGDLDGNGSLDAFIANEGGQADQVYINDGSGGFTLSQSLGSSSSWRVSLGDLDGNGSLDAFTATIDGANRVWINNGSGSFTAGQLVGSSNSYEVSLGDLDGNGTVDAFVANYNSQANKVWFNDGNAVFTDSGQSLGASSSLAVSLGDLDGNGTLDAFVGNISGGSKVWLNNGSGVFTDSGQSLAPGSSAYGVSLGDVDGDNDIDAFVANRWSGANDLWLNTNAAAAPTTVYVDDAWSSGFSNGQAIADADLGTTGSQGAVFGTDAFATVTEALAAVKNGGTVIVNDGTYLEDITLADGKTIEITGPDTPGTLETVTIRSITNTDATAKIIIEGDSTLVIGDTAGAANSTIAGVISGSGNLEKIGTAGNTDINLNRLTLTGTNTYTGTTTVTDGAVHITNASALGGGAGGTVVSALGQVRIDANNLTIAESITLNGSKDNGAQDWWGPLVNNGTGNTWSGSITQGSSSRISNNGAKDLTITGGITNAGGANFSLVITRGGSIDFETTAINLGSGGLIQEQGTTTFSVAGNQWGNTSINRTGTIKLNVNDAMPAGTIITMGTNNDSVYNASAILDLNGFDQTIGGITTVGSILGAATPVGSRTVSGPGELTINDNGSREFDGNFTGALDLVKAGTGTLNLSGNTSDYTGSTTINAGILELSADNAAGDTSSILINDPGTLQLNSVTLDRAITADSGGDPNTNHSAIHVVGGGVNEISGAITLLRSTGIKSRVDANTSLEISGGVTGNHSLFLYDDSSGAPGITVTTNPIDIGTNVLAGHGLTIDVAGNTAGTLRADWGNQIALGVDGAFTAPIAVEVANSSNASGMLDLAGHDLEVTSITAGQSSANAIITSSSGTPTLTVTNAAANTFEGVISGSVALEKAGAGTLSLSRANSYTGGTTVNSGTLDLDGQLIIKGALTVDGSGIVQISGTTHNAIGSNGSDGLTSIALQNGGTLTDNTQGSFVQSVHASVTFNNGGTITSETGSNGNGNFGNFLFIQGINVTGSGLATISANRIGFNFAQTVTVADTVAGAGTDLLISSSIRHDRVGLLTKAGAGTLTLTGANVDTSPLAISGGTLEVGGAGTLNGGNYAGAITNNGTFRYNSTADQTLSGVISGTGSLVKDSASTLELTGTSDYTGTTTINSGTLTVDGEISTGADTVTIASGATLSGGGTVNAKISASSTLASIVATGNLTLGLASSGSGYSMQGTLHVGSHQVTLNDSGLALLGKDTILAGGTLIAANGVSLAGSEKISGIGTVQADLTTNSGSLNPGGTGAAGTLTVDGDLDFGAGSAATYFAEFGAANDSLQVTGNVNLTNVDLNPATIAGYVPTDGAQLTLIDNQAAGAVSGTFNSLADGAEITALASGNIKAYISYFGGDGNDVVISFIDTVTPAAVTVGGGYADGVSAFQVRIVGNTLQVLEDGNVVEARAIGAVDALVINGDDTVAGADTFTLDYSDARLLDVDITINGLDPTTDPGDTLVITGGTFGTVTHTNTNTSDGSIDLDGGGADITYTGLEPVDMTGSTATDFVFNLPAGANPDVVLRNSANAGEMELDGSTFESTIFNVPSGSITINGNTGADTITIESLDNSFNADITVNAGAGTDSVTIPNALDYDGNLTITAETINLNASVDTTTGDQIFNGDVLQGVTGTMRLTAANVTFNGDTTLQSGAAHEFQILATQVTNSAAGTFDVNGGRLKLEGGSQFVNSGIFETGDNGAVPIFGGATAFITNNGTFNHNAAQLRLYMEIINNGVLNVANPSGATEIQFRAPSTIGSGGKITNNGTLNISDEAARFDESGSIVNATGGIINATGASVTFAEDLTVTNQSGGTVNLNGSAVEVNDTTLTNNSGGILNLTDGSLDLTNGGSATSAGTTNVIDTDYTIGGTGTFTNSSGGVFDLSPDGTVRGLTLNTALANSSGGTINFSNGGHFDLDGTGSIENAGLFDHIKGTGNDNVHFNDFTFNNLTGGTYRFHGGGDIEISGNGVFNNSGTLERTATAAGDSVIFDFGTGANGTFNNLDGGIVRSLGGILHIAAQGGNTSHAGSQWIADGGDLRIGGIFEGTLNGSSANGGFVEITDRSNSEFFENVTVGAAGLIINITGDGFLWDDSNITTGGNSLTNTGVMAISGTAAKTLTGTLTNSGTLNIEGDVFVTNGDIVNASGGTTNFTSGTITLTNAGDEVINQSGATFNIVAGGIKTLTGGEIRNESGGTLDFQEGTVALTGATDVIRNEAGGIFTFSTGGTSAIEGNGYLINDSGATATWADGRVDIGTNATLQNDGIFNFASNSNENLGGTGEFLNNGAFHHLGNNVNSDNIVALAAGTFTNNGLFAFDSRGDFQLRPGYTFTNTATGTIRKTADNNSDPAQFFDNNGGLAGTVENEGTVEIQVGTLRVTTSRTGGFDDVVLTQVVGTELTGGTWIANPTGANNAIIDLEPAEPGGIVTIGTNATVSLTGVGRLVQLTNFLAQIDGSLTLNDGQVLDAAAAVTVSSTGTLAGRDGTIIGNVTVQSGGTLTPGDGASDEGTLTVTGDLTLEGDVNIDISGTTNSTHDAIVVSGAVLIDGNLNLNIDPGTDFTGMAIGTEIVLISGGSLTVTDPFTGLHDGIAITIGGAEFTLDYGGVSGNDLVLTAQGVAETSITLDGSNNLVITDITSVSDDTLSIAVGANPVSGTGSGYIITDLTQVISTNIANAVRVSEHQVFIDFTDIGGTELQVDTVGGTDMLTLDFGGGGATTFQQKVILTGGESAGDNDTLTIDNGVFGVVTHNMTAGEAGNIDLDNDTVADVTYSELEPVDMSGSTATDFVFNLPAGADNAQLSQAGAIFTLESTDATPTFESTAFVAPSGSITINGTAGDKLTLSSALDLSANNTDLVFDVPTIDFGGFGVNTGTGNQTFDGNLTLSGSLTNIGGDIVVTGTTTSVGGQIWTIDTSGTSSLQRTNQGRITKEGAGSLTLEGTTDNSGLGATVNAGTLILAKDPSTSGVHAIGGGGLTINNGGTVNIAGSGGDQIYSPANVTVNAGGQLNVTVSEAINGFSGDGGVDLDAGTTLSVGHSDASSTFDGIITGDGGLTKLGDGTLTLGGTNTYSGVTTISAGIVKITNTQAFGNNTGKTVIEDGGTLDINGTRVGNPTEAVEVIGAGAGGIGAVINSGGSATSAFFNLTMTGDATFSAGSRWDISSNFDMGGFTLTKVGTGPVYLKNANIINPGSVDITAGALYIESNTEFDGTGTITVRNGAQLAFNRNSASHSVGLILEDGSNIFTRSFGGVAAIPVIEGNVTLVGGTATINTQDAGGGTSSSFTLNGVVSGAGGLRKVGDETLFLNGNNTYAGLTTINDGIVQLGSTTALGAAGTVANGTVVGSGGALDLNGNHQANERIEINGAGAGVATNGALFNSAGSMTNDGVRFLTLGSDASVGNNGGRFGLNSGTVSGAFTLTKVGSNDLWVGSTVTVDNIVIDGGVYGMQTNDADNITGTITVNASGTLGTWETKTFDAPIVMNGGRIDTGAPGGSDHSVTFNGNVTLNGANNRFHIVDVADAEFTGIISGGGDLIKSDSGILTLSGDNTYGGTTLIQTGEVQLDGDHTGAGAYTVNNGTTFSGDGSTDSTVTVNVGGTLSPGTGPGVSLGTLNTGNLNVDGNFTVEVTGFDGAGDANGHDQTGVTGTVDLDAGTSTLNLNTSGLSVAEMNANAQAELIIIDNNLADSVTGEFSNYAEADEVASNIGGTLLDLVLTYHGGDGNDVALIAGNLTTRIFKSGNDLIIEDINDVTNDQLTVEVVGGNLVVTEADTDILIDAQGAFDGTTGDLSNQVTIDLTTFSGNVILRTKGGDDTVLVENLDLIGTQGFTVEDGTGTDTVTFQSSASDLNNGNVSVTADDITVDAAVNSGGGNVNLVSTSDIDINAAVTGSGGDLTFTSDFIAIGGNISSTGGNLLIAPLTASTTIGIGGGTGDLNLTDTELAFLQDGFSSITIGNTAAGTGAVDIDSSVFQDDVTVVGGSIAVTELEAGTIDVTLTARTGAITDGGDGGTDVIGDDVRLNAGGDIAATGDELSLAANTIDTDSTLNGANGDQFVSETDDVTVNGFNAGSGTVSLNTSGEFDLTTNAVSAGTSVVVDDGTTLDVNGSTHAGSFAGVTVKDGGTLTGDGDLGSTTPVVVEDGGTSTLGDGGNANPGLVNSGDLTLHEGSEFIVEIDGTNGGGTNGGHDQFTVTGMVTLNNPTLLLEELPATYTPTAGDTFTIIENDGGAGDPNSGIFIGLTEGTYISSPKAGLPDHLFQITYLGDDGNDVILTASGKTATTNVTIDDDGNLVVEDILGADTNDNLQISRTGSNYIIEDLSGHTLGTLIVGATQTSLSRVVVPVSLISAGLIVTTLGGDDTVAVQDLGTLNNDGQLTITGGDDFDRIFQAAGATATLTGTGAATYTAEAITLRGTSNLTTDSGKITLTGTGGGASGFAGVLLSGATVQSTSGDIELEGEGGDTGSGNVGIALYVDTATSTASSIATGGTGTITLTGTGGSAGYYAHGVEINGSNISSTSTAATAISIDGNGGMGGNGDYGYSGISGYNGSISATSGGVTLDGAGGTSTTSNFNAGISMISATVSGTTLDVSGQGGDGLSYNRGIFLSSASDFDATAGSATLTGTGGGAGTYNDGIYFEGSTVDGTDMLTIDGTGSTSATNTFSNSGVLIYNTTTTGGSGLDIDGVGGTGSGGYNHAINVYNSTASGGSGATTITGIANNSGDTNGYFNVGTGLNYSTISGATLDIDGTGGSGTWYNRGVVTAGGSLTATGTIDIDGNSANTTSGGYNDGVYLQGTATDASGKLTITGTGSTSTTNSTGNNGVYIFGGSADGDGGVEITGISGTGSGGYNTGVYLYGVTSVDAGSNTVKILGTADSSINTAGYFNIGTNIQYSTVSGASLDIDGVGGSGSWNNRGVMTAGGSLTATAGAIDLDGSSANNNSGGYNDGVYMSATATTASGLLTIDGTGSTSTAGNTTANNGVYLYSGTANGGAGVVITGIGGTGSGGSNYGTSINYTSIDSGSNSVAISGTANATATGSYNVGAAVQYATVTGNRIFIDGTGGGGGWGNRGVLMTGGTTTASASTGTGITITGDSSNLTTGGGNDGVQINATSLTAANSKIVIDGDGSTGASNTTASNGVYLSGATLNSKELEISGDGGVSSGGSNYGVYFFGGNYTTTGTATTLITGNGGTGAGGYNYGAYIYGATISANNSTLDIDGTASASASGTTNAGIGLLYSYLTGDAANITGIGGTGSDYNRGIYMVGGSVTADNGDAKLTGNTHANAAGAYNEGINASGATIRSTSGQVIVAGDGGTSASNTHNNHGVYLYSVTANGSTATTVTGNGGRGSGGSNTGITSYYSSIGISSSTTTITGMASALAGGSYNVGTSLQYSTVIGSTLGISGTGGSGVDNNRGVYIVGGSAKSMGVTTIAGMTNGGTTGWYNYGVDIQSAEVGGSTSTTVTGDGGGGMGFNHGIYMQSITEFGAAPFTTNGTVGDGPYSEDTAGDYFP